MYDVAIIGAGPGGYVAAIRAAQLGLKTCCIDKRKELGGTCLNVGCIPSKALLHSSEMFWKLQVDGAKEGIVCSGLSIDFPQMMKRKEEVVAGFTKGIEGLFKKNKIEWIHGTGRLVGAQKIDVEGKIVEARHIILATGSEPIALPGLAFDEKKIVSSTGALAFGSVPKKLLVVGAGIIGVELGSVYKRLGSEVEFLEFLDHICPTFDRGLSAALQKSLTMQGMVFHLSHKVMKAEVGKGVTLTAQGPNGETVFTGDAALVCVGRRPYSDKLGLEEMGIKKDAKGFVIIDGSFRTSLPNVFAIGDLVEGPMLAHKASEEGYVVAELIAGHKARIDYLAIPNVAYTFPEVASVGLTEEEAKARNIAVKKGQFPFKANSRARCTGEDEGFVKILCEAGSKRIVGVHIIGPHASELIAEAVLAVQLKVTAEQLAETCQAHPTLSEAIKEAAMAAVKSAVHI